MRLGTLQEKVAQQEEKSLTIQKPLTFFICSLRTLSFSSFTSGGWFPSQDKCENAARTRASKPLSASQRNASSNTSAAVSRAFPYSPLVSFYSWSKEEF